MQVVREGDRRATVSYEAQNVRPDRDFDLYYSLSSDAVAVNLLSYKPFDEDGFFLLLVTPPVEAAGQAVAKDVVLVMDTSGSMDGEKIVQAKAAADYVLDHLGQDDRFNIVAFSTATRLFSDRPVPAARRDEGHAFVRSLAAAGSTDINRALLEALAGADAERPTVLIFLTDGLPTAGEVDPDRIVANIAADGAEIGAAVRLRRGLRRRHRPARSTQQRPARDQHLRASRSRTSRKRCPASMPRSAHPCWSTSRRRSPACRSKTSTPTRCPTCLRATSWWWPAATAAVGRRTLTLRGEVNGEPRAYTYRDLAFAERGGQEFIARLWAQRKIGYLLSQIRLHGVKDELVKEIVTLSSRYGIVTPYTSFLVQEPSMALSQEGRDQLGPGASGARPAVRRRQAAQRRAGRHGIPGRRRLAAARRPSRRPSPSKHWRPASRPPRRPPPRRPGTAPGRRQDLPAEQRRLGGHDLRRDEDDRRGGGFRQRALLRPAGRAPRDSAAIWRWATA